MNQQPPQLNNTKSVELIIYARVHLLNESRLYKMDQTKKLLTSCSFITSRADTDAVGYINARGHQQ